MYWEHLLAYYVFLSKLSSRQVLTRLPGIRTHGKFKEIPFAEDTSPESMLKVRMRRII